MSTKQARHVIEFSDEEVQAARDYIEFREQEKYISQLAREAIEYYKNGGEKKGLTLEQAYENWAEAGYRIRCEGGITGEVHL